jgi:hypothetical protein
MMTPRDIAAIANDHQEYSVEESQRDELLAEVDLKWLLAGQGRWVDCAQMHSNATYARQILQEAVASPVLPLHDCGVDLQKQML